MNTANFALMELQSKVEGLLGHPVSEEHVVALGRIFAGTPAPDSAARTALHDVQERFVAELRDSGIHHTLEWIGRWYGCVAAARVEQTLKNELGEHASDREAVVLTCEAYVESLASGVSNRGSSDGAKLMKDAEVSAWATHLRRFSPAARSQRWDAVRARLAPEAAA